MHKHHQKSRPPPSPRSPLKTASKRPNLKKLLRKAQVKPLKQVAALPFRVGADGRIEVLLITSRDTGRWIIPKGWPMAGRKAHQAAEREAYEEAGLEGQIAANPVGRYHYQKRFDHGRAFPAWCASTRFGSRPSTSAGRNRPSARCDGSRPRRRRASSTRTSSKNS